MNICPGVKLRWLAFLTAQLQQSSHQQSEAGNGSRSLTSLGTGISIEGAPSSAVEMTQVLTYPLTVERKKKPTDSPHTCCFQDFSLSQGLPS